MIPTILHRECTYQDENNAEYIEWLSDGTIREIESREFYQRETIEELPWNSQNQGATTLNKLKDSHLRNISRLIEGNPKMPTWKRQCYLAAIARILADRQMEEREFSDPIPPQ
jgi:hypothetical protein